MFIGWKVRRKDVHYGNFISHFELKKNELKTSFEPKRE